IEVKFPGAVLLCLQLALQPVGKLADQAVQIGHLLIELMTQARKLRRLAKIARLGNLVELGGIGVIRGGLLRIAEIVRIDAAAVATGLIAGARRLHIGAFAGVGIGAVLARPFLGAGVLRGACVLGFVLAFAAAAFGFRLLLALIPVGVIVAVRKFAFGIVDQVKIAQQLAGRARKFFLIANGIQQLGEIIAAFLFELGTPQINH